MCIVLWSNYPNCCLPNHRCHNPLLSFNKIISDFLAFKKIFYLFIFRERKGRKKETSTCGCLSCTPYRGPGQEPRHVPWLGIKPATLWFTGQCSIHWATPARAVSNFVIIPLYFIYINKDILLPLPSSWRILSWRLETQPKGRHIPSLKGCVILCKSHPQSQPQVYHLENGMGFLRSLSALTALDCPWTGMK